MRRADREVTDFNDILAIMEKCDVCRLGLRDGEDVYILPLNFGMKAENGQVELYFHSAREGKKTELFSKNGRVSFEMDCGHELDLHPQKGCTMNYESVMGRGHIVILPEEEKADALQRLMEHYRHGEFPINQKLMPHTLVYKLEVEDMTAKRRQRKP